MATEPNKDPNADRFVYSELVGIVIRDKDGKVISPKPPKKQNFQ